MGATNTKLQISVNTGTVFDMIEQPIPGIDFRHIWVEHLRK